MPRETFPPPSTVRTPAPGSVTIEHIYNEVHALRADLDAMARWFEVFVHCLERMPQASSPIPPDAG